ncbi:MAG: hypothetical protein ABI743_05110, partial [bacterium]
GSPIHLLRVCPEPVEAIPEARWEAIEDAIHEALTFGVDRFIIDLTGAGAVRPLDYWMLLNLAILIPAGHMVVLADQEQLQESLRQSKLIRLISIVEHLADAYGVLTGIAVGPVGGTNASTTQPPLESGLTEL